MHSRVRSFNAKKSIWSSVEYNVINDHESVERNYTEFFCFVITMNSPNNTSFKISILVFNIMIFSQILPVVTEYLNWTAQFFSKQSFPNFLSTDYEDRYLIF